MVLVSLELSSAVLMKNASVLQEGHVEDMHSGLVRVWYAFIIRSACLVMVVYGVTSTSHPNLV